MSTKIFHYLKTLGSINLHRHVEGVLTPSDLFEIAKQALPDTYTTFPWKAIRAAHSEKKLPNFENFLQRLSTRWMQLLIKKSVARGISPDIPLRLMFDRILTKAAGENIQTIEFLACPLALASDEISHDLTIASYCQVFRACVDHHPSCVWAEKKEKGDSRMEVGLKFCLRREQQPETVLLTTNKSVLSQAGKRLADKILRLYQEHSIIGVDIAGDEKRPDRRLSQFNAFFKYIKDASIPFTVHAGELSKETNYQELAYDNLSYAIHNGASRIGHAVRLFDDNPRFIILLAEALEKGMYFELNLTSNQWTGVAPDPHNHPIIRAVGRHHSLFKTDQPLHAKLLNSVTVSDDDPVVFGESDTPLAEEICKVGTLTSNFGFDSEEEFVKHLNTVGQKAKQENTTSGGL